MVKIANYKSGGFRKVKKIGILTFHRSYNYGAFMQCYSLSQRIAKDFPECKVEVIDYCTERMIQNYPTQFWPYILGPTDKRNSKKQMVKQFVKLLLNPNILNEKRSLYQGFKENLEILPLSDFRIVSDKFDTLFERIDEEYDILIVGSDAVWEYRTYPFPNAYFPNYDFKHTKLMSYAASSDRMHSSVLDTESRQYIADTLERFEYIGIRDVATENFLRTISTNFIVHHNCDPTLFMNLDHVPSNLERVKKDLVDHGISLNKPIIGLMGNNELCNMLRKMFGKKYQIVAIYQHVRGADYNLDYLTPFEWAKIFSLFSVTVTKFFHGSILSLKNGTPTIATDYWFKTDKYHITKIEDLYQRLGLYEHYFYMPDIGAELQKLKDQLEYFIEYPDGDKIYRSIQRESQSYMDFKNALSIVIKCADR